VLVDQEDQLVGFLLGHAVEEDGSVTQLASYPEPSRPGSEADDPLFRQFPARNDQGRL
jgi:hypothetical protein